MHEHIEDFSKGVQKILTTTKNVSHSLTMKQAHLLFKGTVCYCTEASSSINTGIPLAACTNENFKVRNQNVRPKIRNIKGQSTSSNNFNVF